MNAIVLAAPRNIQSFDDYGYGGKAHIDYNV